jgi:hypothetical protein
MNFLKGKVCDQFHKPSMRKFRYWNAYSSFPLSVMVEKNRKIKTWFATQKLRVGYHVNVIMTYLPQILLSHTQMSKPHNFYIGQHIYPFHDIQIIFPAYQLQLPLFFLLQWLFLWIHEWHQHSRICNKIKFATY